MPPSVLGITGCPPLPLRSRPFAPGFVATRGLLSAITFSGGIRTPGMTKLTTRSTVGDYTPGSALERRWTIASSYTDKTLITYIPSMV